jgi:hypothetical protein
MFPDCSFQLDWKEYRGMLCFKELPSDLITVSKRDRCLRVDYHVRDLTQTGKKKGYYSLVLKAEPKEENTLFMISHNEKTIRNVLEDKDITAIKEKYSVLAKMGSPYNLDVSDLKAIHFPQENRLSVTIQTYYQNYSTGKQPQLPRFKCEKEYFREVVESEVINYAQLEKNEVKAVLGQKVVAVEKAKSKFVEGSCSVDVEWAQESLNLTHLQLILRLALLAFPQSLVLSKIRRIAEMFEDPVFLRSNFRKQLPLRCKFSS